jgi:hypothetical protein
MEKACAEMHHCFLAKRMDPAPEGLLSESEVGRAAMPWRFGGAADCPMEWPAAGALSPLPHRRFGIDSRYQMYPYRIFHEQHRVANILTVAWHQRRMIAKCGNTQTNKKSPAQGR